MKREITTAIAASIVGVATLQAQERPNIILFLVDDLGWNDTSLPISGEKTKYNERYSTPNLEKMAQRGIMMTNAHAQALSVPSRASLMSGQNSIRNGVTGDYTPTVNNSGTLEIEAGHPLDHRITLPKQLQRAGYKTIHCGKYHLCEYESDAPSPSDIGFDVNIAGSELGAPGSFLPEDNFTRKGKSRDGEDNVMVGLERYFGSETHLTDALTEVAIEQMGIAVEEQKPFFLYLAHFAVHTPVQPHSRFMDRFDDIDDGLSASEDQYGSMISGVDASLGAILAALESLEIDDNTMVIFYSDNGGRVLFRDKKSLYDSFEHNYPLRSGKASAYEGGVRVPAVAYWPAKFKEGVVSDAPVMIEDLYTTCAALAKAKIPAQHIVDGHNLLPLFTTGKAPKSQQERSMFFYLPYRFEGEEFLGPDFVDGGISPSSTINKEGWKLIYFHRDQSFELYNLNSDISEQNNLIDSQQRKARALVEELDEYLQATAAINSIQLPEREATPLPLDAFNKRYK
ncbi:MAG: sulfatase [Rikenellaceae bacterium]